MLFYLNPFSEGTQIYKQMTHDQMIDRIFARHLSRQADINYAYLKNQMC